MNVVFPLIKNFILMYLNLKVCLDEVIKNSKQNHRDQSAIFKKLRKQFSFSKSLKNKIYIIFLRNIN